MKDYVKFKGVRELLKKDTITVEERVQITEQMMITITDRISAKDTENKDFLNGIIKYGGVPIIGGALVLEVVILGVRY
ncbi:hypothetical protein [Lysinibacillus sp. NPDC056185]|uniref:hypothetical protein n=1 Tax=Lysinibacillus sp. NPDC056185 TaxID=3345739 RepID=UPI0039EE7E08